MRLKTRHVRRWNGFQRGTGVESLRWRSGPVATSIFATQWLCLSVVAEPTQVQGTITVGQMLDEECKGCYGTQRVENADELQQ